MTGISQVLCIKHSPQGVLPASSSIAPTTVFSAAQSDFHLFRGPKLEQPLIWVPFGLSFFVPLHWICLPVLLVLPLNTHATHLFFITTLRQGPHYRKLRCVPQQLLCLPHRTAEPSCKNVNPICLSFWLQRIFLVILWAWNKIQVPCHSLKDG